MEQNVVVQSKEQLGKLKQWLRKINPLFWLTVIIPTFCSLFYFSIWLQMFIFQSLVLLCVLLVLKHRSEVWGFIAEYRFCSFAR